MPSVKTDINNIYRGFTGLRIQFCFVILLEFNDFCGCWPIFDLLRKKWPKVTVIVKLS
jgi:hypothetical protein